jgi:hypothetical protein
MLQILALLTALPRRTGAKLSRRIRRQRRQRVKRRAARERARRRRDARLSDTEQERECRASEVARVQVCIAWRRSLRKRVGMQVERDAVIDETRGTQTQTRNHAKQCVLQEGISDET